MNLIEFPENAQFSRADIERAIRHARRLRNEALGAMAAQAATGARRWLTAQRSRLAVRVSRRRTSTA